MLKEFLKENGIEIDLSAVWKVSKIFTLIGLLIGLALSSVYTVSEQEQAVVTTFGNPKAVTEPGLKFKIPFIQKVTKIDATIQGFPIGYRMGNETEDELGPLWSAIASYGVDNSTTVEESGSYTEYTKESLMITSDYNFVNVDFFVEYKVSDPIKRLFNSEKPVDILKNICQGCIRTVVSNYTVDEVLTTGKNEIQAGIKAAIIEKLEKQDIGLQLINITIQDSEPPTVTVMEAFKAVETAKQNKETTINNANKYRNEKLPEAQAEADEIKQSAEAEKTTRINEATAQVARFNSMYEEYIKNPEVTKQRMFFEAMEDVLPDLKIVIEGKTGSVEAVYPIDSFASITAGN